MFHPFIFDNKQPRPLPTPTILIQSSLILTQALGQQQQRGKPAADLSLSLNSLLSYAGGQPSKPSSVWCWNFFVVFCLTGDIIAARSPGVLWAKNNMESEKNETKTEISWFFVAFALLNCASNMLFSRFNLKLIHLTRLAACQFTFVIHVCVGLIEGHALLTGR